MIIRVFAVPYCEGDRVSYSAKPIETGSQTNDRVKAPCPSRCRAWSPGVLGFGALAYWPEIRPISPPPPTGFASGLVARVRPLQAVDIARTAIPPRAGKICRRLSMPTPFGVIHSTNITPDPETGIGAWSEAAFARAMREGIARDGSHLFPAFPYDHFTKVSDDDVRALYAYFMTRPPVRAPRSAKRMPFPLNIRDLQAGWKLLFFRSGRFEPDAGKSDEWNRGAYLALGLEPLRRLPHAAQLARRGKGGRRLCRRGDRQLDRAAVDRRKPCSGPWTQEELHGYLRNGVSVLHGIAAGPMSPVVHGLAALPEIGCPGHRSVFRRHRPCARAPGVPPASSGARDVLRTPRHRAGVRRRRAPLHGRLRFLPL